MTVCICVKGDEFGPDLLTDQCEVHRPKAPLFYTGIGARQTPPAMLATITAIASRLATLGWTCRTGGADGADTAFEVGGGNWWPRGRALPAVAGVQRSTERQAGSAHDSGAPPCRPSPSKLASSYARRARAPRAQRSPGVRR